MRGKVTCLQRAGKEFENRSFMAEVIETEGGEALSVRVPEEGISVPVAGHLSGIPLLEEGDRVLAQMTTAGLVIVGRLRKTGEPPMNRIEEEDGRLKLTAREGIRLQCGESLIEIEADGRIRVDGREVCAVADGRLRLQGSTIELN